MQIYSQIRAFSFHIQLTLELPGNRRTMPGRGNPFESNVAQGQVAPGNRTPRPSRPGESHPEALTDPCLSLSAHTARAIHRELAPSVTTRRFLPLPVDQSGYDANDPPPSLHGHYSTS